MSATIKYKGETIATASNNTKTLLTAGKYMEANVVVTDNGGGSPTLQTKSVSYTPSETATSDSVTPDTGYDGLDRVNVSVGAIDPNYVGSEVPVRDSSNLTVSDYDEYVTADAGYYPNAVTKYLTPKLKPSPVVSLNTSNGRVTATATYSSSDETVGYHDSGTAVGTLQLVTRSARTYTPTTADQTISSGQYLIGNQTILGDADLVAGNIKKDVNIFGVTGTYEGSSSPASAPYLSYAEVGNDGSIYVDMEIDQGGYIAQDTYSLTKANAVTMRTSSDMTTSGATVTAPSGYYSASASKTIPNAPTPRLADIDIESNGTATATVEVDDGGYIQGQTFSLSLANAVTVQAAQTITPGTTNQTIPAYRWTTGTQTILGDADLVASNIKAGVTIFGITGTYEGGAWVEETITTSGAVTKALDPYVLYHFTGALTSLTITLNAPSSGQIAHYHFDFLSGSTAPTLTMPNSVTMPDSFSVEASKRYEVDVLNNFGTVVEWAN